MKILIVGGVAGGATAAARMRRMDENAEIILFERGDYISYANCGLPYYIGGTIDGREELLLQTPEGMNRRYAVDVRTGSEAVALNPEEKTLTVRTLASGETYTEHFDKLLLSTGAEPLRPPIAGIRHPHIFTLRNIPDTDALKTFVRQQRPASAVIVGGGFIGLEMSENLHQAGVEVHLVEMADQVMAPLDYSMAAIVHQHLRQKGVHLWLGEKVKEFAPLASSAGKLAVQMDSGRTLETDLVILSIGVRPETKLAQASGLETGKLGGIAVNAFMQTSHPDIYAIGDAVEVFNPATDSPAMIPLAGPANKQARIAADNILQGNSRAYGGSIGVSVAKVFDLTVASAGAPAKLLKRLGVNCISSYTHGLSHAGYYPGAQPLSVKIIFSPADGQLFGVQIAGYGGVDKRIEMCSQIIRRKGTVCDLAELEQAYAPPYSSAKDPVNTAGFVAENILTGKVKIAHWRDIRTLNFEKDFLLDVRTVEENKQNRIEGSHLIPVDELRSRLGEIPRHKRIIVYCAVGLRGYIASRILMQHGFREVYNLSGGITTYTYAAS
ncbi:MAG: FAD-dependent oxidoreductase [Tannerellaceae bacterium]|jgi:NADPH-dependent 2,4-dienoyl-CoA reductase/sulfur reductase-like enzyme/rhodanese-related sulfurtransferase|nr:FAD-dependent oxidoreductase [Tannerellaceae bacterium]